MTPNKFKFKMEQLYNRYKKDEDFGEEDVHMAMDSLMSKALIELGYGDGVAIYNKTSKWYS